MKIVIALLLSACAATPRAATPAIPFACRGDDLRAPQPPRERIPRPDPRPARRLDVERVGEDIRLVADDAPLGEVAIALGAAVGMDVLVDPELVGRRVSVSVSDVGIEAAAGALARSAGAMLGRHGGALHFATVWRAREEARLAVLSMQETRPLEVRVLPVPAHMDPAHVASAFCRVLATPHGAAAVADREVLVRDVSEAIDRLEEWIAHR